MAHRRDTVVDRRVLVGVSALVALGYGTGASLQSTYIYSQLLPEWAEVSLLQRLAANGVAVATLALALVALQVHALPRAAAVVRRVVLACALCAAARVAAQVVAGVYARDDVASQRAELVGGLVAALISGGVGTGAMVWLRRARARTRAAERAAVAVELAVRALENEEIRVRRQVAEGLHGTLQQRLVLIEARLAELVRRGRLPDEVVGDFGWVREQLAEARDADVRQMSRLLYPDRLELGLVPAVRALLSRLPATIATSLRASDAVRRRDDPTRDDLLVADRLLALRVVEEAVTNALKNGPPQRVDVVLDLVDDVLLIEVVNDGDLYAPRRPDPASGTARLAERLAVVGGRLAVGPGATTGARVEARLPLAPAVDGRPRAGDTE
ncbi:ATP-binding protein [Cellulomonas sp. JZ18]|uniref:sensor histidine kinase n=1 Tax=Cellulomonas sp. JZ18 TaxID=2654191 RepID=UPI0012D37D59|nr:ATP-binding protein [Cellulomonas sp. JZ18]QGQ20331.1 ATP-binding protein [Cellulomonas sp. JZ18]